MDPRFTRTSAMSDLHVAIRSGSDIAFLGGIINFILTEDRWFKDYVLHYTNAATILADTFQDTEDLDGLFSGFDPRRGSTTPRLAVRRHAPRHASARDERDQAHQKEGQPGVDFRHHPPRTDPTLQHPRCVFQILKRHYAPYTPELVARVCGCTEASSSRWPDAVRRTQGLERTSAFAYAVGWTQHTVGRAIHPRGHASERCSETSAGPAAASWPCGATPRFRARPTSPRCTTCYPATSPPRPRSCRSTTRSRAGWRTRCPPPAGGPTAGNTWCRCSALVRRRGAVGQRVGLPVLPKNVGDHSHMPMFVAMHERVMRGFMAIGQNPAVGGQNAVYQRAGMAQLDWLVVKDLFVTETAEFWKAPDVPDPSISRRKCSSSPPPRCRRSTGVHQHPATGAVARPGRGLTGRLQERPLVHPPARQAPQAALRRLDQPERRTVPGAHLDLRGAQRGGDRRQRAQGGQRLYAARPETGRRASPISRTMARRRRGVGLHGRLSRGRQEPRGGRSGDDYVALGWAFAWPANRRILYNRASADPAGRALVRP